MKILHFYPRNNEMAVSYVETLRTALDSRADIRAAATLAEFRKAMKEMHPDIVHIHGCWRWANALAARMATRQGARLVLSPHGGLEPWVVKLHFWKERLPHLVVYQRRLVRKAFAVIVMGRMEAESVRRTKLNPRFETVRNAHVTSTITPADMAASVMAIYRKTLDSFPRPLMDDTATTALRAFIKAGLTGDEHWLDNDEYQSTRDLSPEAWRQVLLTAFAEGIYDTVVSGVAVAGCTAPADINPEATPVYPPHQRRKPATLDTQGKDDTDRMAKAIHSAHKLLRQHQLTLAHAVALAALVRECPADEEKLAYRLKTQGLLPFARRLMTALEELTGLEEGMMPVEQLADKRAAAIIQKITNHNSIL